MKKSRAERDFESLLPLFGGAPEPKPKSRAASPRPAPSLIPDTADRPAPKTAPPAVAAAAAAEVQDLQSKLAKAEAALQTAREAADAARADTESVRQQLAAAVRQRDEFDSERRANARQVTEAEKYAAELRRSLQAANKGGVFDGRGIEADERGRAVVLLVRTFGSAGADALLAADPAPLQALLDRVVLSCGAAACLPKHQDTAALEVSRDRCEVCAGSQAGTAFAEFAKALNGAGFSECTVVGGTPVYREMLRELGKQYGRGILIKTVADLRPDAGKRAKGTRGLVILWGGTAVDHAVTIHYKQAGDRVIDIAHRGIGGMLARAAALLAK